MTSTATPHDELITVRRRLHEHPELSMVEHDTAAFVAEKLRGMKLDEVRTGVGITGVLGTLRGGKPGPVTLLRADMTRFRSPSSIRWRTSRSVPA
jgi:metal-dependent amidase/aminoacylase/carboxypeptidase family protein